MDAPTLLKRLDELGVSVVLGADGKAVLRPPKLFSERQRAEFADLLPLLRLHREAVLAHCQGSTPPTTPDAPFESVECEECGNGVHTADAAAVWACCGRLMCPWWRDGFPPGWVKDARNRERYRRERGG